MCEPVSRSQVCYYGNQSRIVREDARQGTENQTCRYCRGFSRNHELRMIFFWFPARSWTRCNATASMSSGACIYLKQLTLVSANSIVLPRQVPRPHCTSLYLERPCLVEAPNPSNKSIGWPPCNPLGRVCERMAELPWQEKTTAIQTRTCKSCLKAANLPFCDMIVYGSRRVALQSI